MELANLRSPEKAIQCQTILLLVCTRESDNLQQHLYDSLMANFWPCSLNLLAHNWLLQQTVEIEAECIDEATTFLAAISAPEGM